MFVALSLTAAYTMVISLNAARAMPDVRRPLQVWGLGTGVASAATFLYFLRGVAPDLLTHGVANLLMVITALMSLHAHARLLDLPRLRGTSAALLGAALAAMLAQSLGWLGTIEAAAVFSLLGGSALAALTVLMARRLWRLQGSGRSECVGAMLVAALVGTGFLVRGIVSLTHEPQLAAYAPAHPAVMPLVLALCALYLVGGSVSFLSMVHDAQRRELLDRARRDVLTGTYSRRGWAELAQQALAGAGGTPVALLLLDLDHFKAINDTHGHLVGDQVLVQASRLLTGSVRAGDLVGRLGGDEFCILLPGCDEAAARDLARRLVEQARQHPVRLRDGTVVPYGWSVGCASLRLDAGAEPGALLDALTAAADRAMFDAKHAGRGRVGLAAAPAVDGGWLLG